MPLNSTWMREMNRTADESDYNAVQSVYLAILVLSLAGIAATVIVAVLGAQL
jgi:hypothetical protein